MSITTTEVARRSGVSYRQLDYWRSRGVIGWVADLPASPGSGNPVIWDADDVRVISVLGRYAEAFGTRRVDDLAGLGQIAARHDSGYAVRSAAGVWRWAPIAPGAPDEPIVVVPLEF